MNRVLLLFLCAVFLTACIPNGDVIESIVPEENEALYVSIPEIVINIEEITSNSISFEVEIFNDDNLSELNRIELYLNNVLIKNYEASVRKISDLLSNNEYEIRLVYSYTTTEELGLQEEIVFQNFKTLENLKPSIELNIGLVTTYEVKFDLSILDSNNLGQLAQIELYEKGQLLNQYDTTVREISNLQSNKKYEIRLIYIYDLLDGKGQQEIEVLEEFETKRFVGLGTEDQPFLIGSAEEFLYLNMLSEEEKFAHFKLTSSISFNNQEFHPIKMFEGVLDGNNRVIRNINIFINDSSGVLGIIQYNQGTIKDISFDNISYRINSSASLETITRNIELGPNGVLVGGIIGVNDYNGIIQSVKAKTNIDFNILNRGWAGGLVGTNNGIIEGVEVTTQILGGTLLGGIAGNNVGQILEASSNSTLSSQNGNHQINIGGIAGTNYGLIQNVFVESRLTAESNDSVVYIGGVTAINYSRIEFAFVSGSIIGESRFNSLYLGDVTGYLNGSNSSIRNSVTNFSERKFDSQSNVFQNGVTGQRVSGSELVRVFTTAGGRDGIKIELGELYGFDFFDNFVQFDRKIWNLQTIQQNGTPSLNPR